MSHRYPYISRDGDLVIPFCSPPRYHWWRGGQTIQQTLVELGASDDVISRHADCMDLVPSKPLPFDMAHRRLMLELSAGKMSQEKGVQSANAAARRKASRHAGDVDPSWVVAMDETE